MQTVLTASLNSATVILNVREESVFQLSTGLNMTHRSFASLEDDNLEVKA